MAVLYSHHGTIVRYSEGYVVHGVEIGTQTWSDRNLDLTFDGLQFNISTVDAVPTAYYNSNSFKKNYGLLYNWYAIKYINDNADRLIPGWHIATESDYSTLFSYIGGQSQCYNKLRSIVWSSGTDSYLFSALPSGYGNPTSSPKCQQVGNEINLGTSTEVSNTTYKVYLIKPSENSTFNHTKGLGTAVRLVRDVT